MKIPKYNMYHNQHPDGTAHGGTAIVIKKNIKHHELPTYDQIHLQATSISVDLSNGSIVLSAIYCPPRHNIKFGDFKHFFKTLGNKFIACGDYNAKHTYWGSRLITTRGRELRNAMLDENYGNISSAEPTYWPTDKNKTLDLLDFCVTNGISSNNTSASSCLELSSDHTPVLLKVSSQVILRPTKPLLTKRSTNCD